MSEDTYYTILGVPESATVEEIKRAYRELIRQVHPDSVPNASPYWRRACEEKSKEINEAYHVLIDPTHRSAYDHQLATFRRNDPLIRSPWARDEDVGREPYVEVGISHPKLTVKKGYTPGPFLQWAGRYPVTASLLAVILFLPIVRFFSNPRPHQTAMAASGTASDGFYSAFPCLDAGQDVSPIDGKPCRKPECKATARQAPDPKPVARLTHPRWFYMTSNGIRALGGDPDDDTCQHIQAKNSAACEASLRYCPQGVWSKSCVSYSKWKRNNTDPPRVEKLLPVWPAQ